VDDAIAGPVEDCEYVDAIVLNTLELKGVVDARLLELVALVLARADVSDDAPKVFVLVVRDVSDDADDEAPTELVLVVREDVSDDVPKVLVLVVTEVSDDA
jgi:hypothetical protein